MDHRQAMELLPTYRDGELDDPRREAIAEHISGCEPCKAELAAWAAIGVAIFRQPAPALPPNFASRVMSQVATQPSPLMDPLWLSLRRWLVPSFGAALAAAALAILWPEGDSPDTTELLLVANAPENASALTTLVSSTEDVDAYDEQLLEEP